MRGDLTQAEFAAIIGVTQGTVNKYEKGAIFPGEDVLNKIADHCGVRVEWLLHGEERGAAPQLLEEPQQIYLATRPALMVDLLVRANGLTRKFIKAAGIIFTDQQEAQLSAYIYEYLEEYHAEPGEVVIRRLADLIKKQEG